MIQSPKIRLKIVLAMVAVTTLVVVACNPQLARPVVEIPTRYVYGENFTQDTLAIGERWWQVFGDDTLNALEEQALLHNNDIEVALARVEQARKQLTVARAELLPSLQLGLSVEGEWSHTEKYQLDYSVEPSLAWEFGVAGRLKHTTGAAKAAITQSEWALRGVKLSVAAEVATGYFTLLQYERNLEIARQTYIVRRESVALVDSMFRHGMSSGLDLEQARSLMYTAAADIAQYERALCQSRLALNTLLGEPPHEVDDRDIGLNLLNDFIPIDIPIGLPSDLLHRRPDVMEAFYALVEAGERVGIARAERFPSFSMTLAGGVASDKLKGLFHGVPFVWSGARSLTQPLYSFGRLKRNEEAAREAYNQSIFTYRQTVLEALAEVEKALVGIESYNAQTERYAELVLTNLDIAHKTRALYEGGLEDYFSLLDAERTLYDSQMQLVEIVVQQYVNYVTLFKALGGGF